MSKYDDTTMVLMKLNKGGDYNTKKYFENLFIKEGGKQLIGYTKEEGEKIDEFKQRWERIKIGDLIVVVEGLNKVCGVVEVTSAPWDERINRDEESDWFVHRRKAKLIKYFTPFHTTKSRTARDTITEYSGSGAIGICDEIWEIIKDEYIAKKKQEEMQDYIDILEHKQQIILQGPPGTGKTYTAEELAKALTQTNTSESPIQKINSFFQKFDPNSQSVINRKNEREELINIFQSRYPKDKIKDLTLDEYCIGTGSNDSFCWWLEEGLKSLGAYFPGTARTYLIYWKREINDYSKHTNLVKHIEDNAEALQLVTNAISEFINTKDFQKGRKIFGESLLLKLLHSYYPDEFAPINSATCLNNVLRIFGIDYSGMDTLAKNKKVQELFEAKKTEYGVDMTNDEFMRFMFKEFDLFGKATKDTNQLVTSGEYKIIQFHPAYTYEDFVRGITTVATDTHIEYRVENKVLAEFAEKALQRPSSKFVLIIDEINRANLPAVLGELIYALEYRYDEANPNKTSVESMYSLSTGLEEDKSKGRIIRLPKNLYIIGTMNTADRSVGHIDYAIRRRFAFKDILPSDEVIKDVVPTKDALQDKALKLYSKVEPLFTKGNIASDFKAKDVQLGHSYFLVQTEKELGLKLKFEILPLLHEYLKDGILNNNVSIKGTNYETENYLIKLENEKWQ